MERPILTTYPNASRRTVGTASTSQDPGSWARFANLALGVWLFLSAFIWQHSPASKTNTWILGVIIALVSLSARRAPGSRFGNTAAAVWLFFSTLAISQYSQGTTWNNLIVAIGVFLCSFVPNRDSTIRAT